MENMLMDKSTAISLRDIDSSYVEAKAYYGELLAGMDKEMLPFMTAGTILFQREA